MAINDKKTIPWINVLKAICILLVFFRHCESYLGFECSWINYLIEPIYVNSFFFISGYLLFKKQLTITPKGSVSHFLKGDGKMMISNIFFRIAVPSTLFAIIEFFPKNLIRHSSFTIGDFLIETIGGCTYWFTSALLVSQLLFFILLFTRINNVWFYSAASVLFAYIGWELSSSGFDIISGHGGFPWLYQNGFIATIYLALGGIYWKYEKLITKHLTCYSIIPLAVLYLIGSSEYMKDYVSCTTSMCSINILGVLCSFIGTILLIELCKIIPNSSFMTYVGKNSIGFYFLCGALPAIISIVLTHLFSVISFYIVLISCALCITIAYITVRLLNRYFPFIFDLRLLFNRK